MKTVCITLFMVFILSSCSTTQTISKSKDRIALSTIETIFKTTEDNICNPSFTQTQQWETFKSELTSKKALALNEADYVSLFNSKRRKLPFTHYYLKLKNKLKTSTLKKEKREAFEIQKLSNETMLLTIRVFSAEAAKMQLITDSLRKTNYENLIIDLRGNSGGTLDAAVVLAQYLSDKMIHGGYFISRSWFEKNHAYPTKEELKQFTPLMDPTYGGFTRKMKEDSGMSLIIPPNGQPTFKGKLFILTDKQTGSTCEPLVFGFKLYKLATIVGERTYGGMLSGYNMKINNKLTLFMPLSDYVTVTNERIDKVGVTPDIEVKSSEALDYVLNSLK